MSKPETGKQTTEKDEQGYLYAELKDIWIGFCDKMENLKNETKKIGTTERSAK